MRRALLAAALAFFPVAVAADDTPATAPVQDWSNSIETVVVTPSKGPLLWHVTKGNSELYIIGIVSPMPKALHWNTAGVEAALNGARELITPPQAKVNLFEGVWFLMWNSSAIYLPGSTPMESTLSEPLRARFVAARERLHQDADRYSSLRVPLAGLRLESDFLDANKLVPRQPSAGIQSLADHAGVRSRPAANYEALPLAKQLPTMSAAANEACLKDALDDVEIQSQHAAAAAEAWAAGDLDGIKANFSDGRFEACLQALPTAAAFFQRAVNDSLAAASAALARPGKTVMVVSVGPLLRKGGILDRLAAQGVVIAAPSQNGS